MLDVHAPHETVHTWRDFFIHVATICVGLLIAIGLEQTVEYIHHRREVRETRAALRAEREEDRKNFAVNTTDFRLLGAQWQNNLRVLTYLQQHPATPEDKLPGVLVWDTSYALFFDSAWRTAQQTGVTAFMPREEVENNSELYLLLHVAQSDFDDSYQDITQAADYAFVDPDPSHLTALQIAAEVDLTKKVLAADYRWGIDLRDVHTEFPEFAPAPTLEELRSLAGRVRGVQDQKKLAAAKALTDAELQPFKAARTTAIKAAHDTNPK
jgi:type II secretory pathway pseudopilin PulG